MNGTAVPPAGSIVAATFCHKVRPRSLKDRDLFKERLMSNAEYDIRESLASRPTEKAARQTRRQAIGVAAKTLAAAGVAALSAQSGGGSARAAETPRPTGRVEQARPGARPAGKLRIVTCQFPVGPSHAENAKYTREFMHKAAAAGAHLLHTSEASL